MKPLPAAPLTEEDRAAWFDWQVNRRRDWALWGALEALSFPQDRRDAQLMHAWTHVLQADGSFRTCPTCWQIAHSPGAGIVAVNITGCA